MSTKLGTLTLDLVARIGNFTQGMRQASSSAEREMQRAGNSVNTMDGLLKKLAATAGAAFSIHQIVNYADSYTGMVNKIKLVTEGQTQLSTAMADTHKIAQATASDWSSVVDVYTKFQKISDRLGLSQSEVARITKTVTKAVGISGASADEAQRSLVQFSQALSLGVLRGQDLNSVMQQTPGLTDAIAKGMGVTSDKLKQMGSDGVLTTQKVVEALQKVAGSVDSDYAETATLIASSFSLVRNEAIKMIGEFDQAHGVSRAFVSGMTTVADNIENITKLMLIAGTYMAGTYIPMIIKGTYATISDTASKFANVTALRAKVVADLEVAKSNLAATAAMARAMGATNAQTAAMMANARAAYQQAAAAKAVAFSGAGLSSVLLGPVGVGVALASVAAGYVLMKDGADKATASIEYQGQKLEDLVIKYRELNTLQRDNETKILAEQVEDLSVKFRVASSDLMSFMQALPASDEKIDFFAKLTKEYQNGKISSDAYYDAVKNVNFLTDEQLDKVRGLTGRYDEAKTKFNEAEVAQKALASAAKKTTQEAKEQAAEVKGLTEEIKKLLGVNAEGTNKSNYLKEMVNLKVDPKLAEMLYEARKAEGLEWGKNQVLSDAVRKSVLERWKADQGLNKTLEERAKIEERNKKIIEAQGNAMKVNAKVASNAAKYNFAGIESKNKLPTGLLSAIHMQESKGDASAYNKSSGATGGFQFLKATGDQYGVKNRNDLAQSAEAAGKYMAYLLKLFEGDLDKAVSAYHAGEGNVQRGTNIGPVNRQYVKNIKGYMGGASGISFDEDYSFDDWAKEQEKLVMEREKREKEQADKQKQLALEVATYREKINTELADKLEEIDKAGFGSAKTAELKAEYTKRAEIDIQVSEASHADKISGYYDYLKSEEQLLNESFAHRQRDLKLDLSLTADEYSKASLAIEDQRKKEVDALRRDEKLDVLEAKREWMNKGDYAREYYALIRDEILATANYSPETKDAMIRQANMQQGIDQNAERENVWGDYQSMMGLDKSPYQQDIDLLAEARAQMLITEEDYQQQRLNMQMSYGSRYGADFAGMMMGLVDSSSSAYAILGGIQKGAALFSTAMNSYAAISSAWASAPFPYNLPAVGIATIETGLLQAAVSALSPTGYAEGGFTGFGGKYAVAGVVHKGEGVLNQEEIAALGGPSGFYALRQSIKNGFAEGGMALGSPSDFRLKVSTLNGIPSQGSQAPNVNVYTLPGETADVSMNSDGSLDVRIRKIVREESRKTINSDANDPNSGFSKAMGRNFNAPRKR